MVVASENSTEKQMLERVIPTTVPAQVVAPDWILSFRIKSVGLEPILEPHQRRTAPGCY